MEQSLRIDEEFQNKIPPLTEAEFKQLEENILECGEVREPIIAWNGTIVDGHNRYKIVLKHPEVKWSVREMNFADKWEAFDWMYKNQLGRRNLTDEQRRYLLGKLYEARKQTHGGDHGNQYTKVATAESRPLAKNRDGVSKTIADEQHIGKTQVKDSYKYAKGIDAIREKDAELADSILKSEKRFSKRDIQEIGNAKPEKQKKLVEEICITKQFPRSKPRKSEGATAQNRKDCAEIRDIVKSFTDDTVMEYTIETMKQQIRVNAASFIGMLSNMIMDHKDICNEYPDEVVKAIDESIIEEINKIKERLSYGTHL